MPIPNLINIYSINKNITDLISLMDIEQVDEFTGEINEEAKEIGQKILKQMCKTIESNAESILELISMYSSYVETIKERKRQLSDLQKKYEGNITTMNKNIMLAMKLLNMESLNTASGTLTITKGQPSVVIKDELLLPEKYLNKKIEITPNKVEIKKAIKDGIAFGDNVSLEYNPYLRKK